MAAVLGGGAGTAVLDGGQSGLAPRPTPLALLVGLMVLLILLTAELGDHEEGIQRPPLAFGHGVYQAVDLAGEGPGAGDVAPASLS